MKKREPLILFVLVGLDLLLAVILLSPKFSSVVSNVIVYITGAVILWYTYETYLLRREAQVNTVYSLKPVVVLNEEECKGFQVGLHNLGQGAALNIEMRIAQFHKDKPGYTNLRKVSLDINNFATLAPLGLKKVMTDQAVMTPYIKAEGKEYSYGVPDRVAFILTYNDVQGRKYCTVIKGNIMRKTYILWKNTLVDDYSSGELPLMERHIIDSSDT